MLSQVRADILTGRLRYDDDGYDVVGSSGNGAAKDKNVMERRRSRGEDKKDITVANMGNGNSNGHSSNSISSSINSSQQQLHYHPHQHNQSDKSHAITEQTRSNKSESDLRRKSSPYTSTDNKPHPNVTLSEKHLRNDPSTFVSTTTTTTTTAATTTATATITTMTVTEKNRKKRLVEAHHVDKKALKAALAQGV